ncbi:MlaA family lipoprotein [Sphingomonas profundi]|uniref:MlaA family lipoprotein n=1 Tax=Alterirhizorhabdus profundi TaxID=2681549 RepID=UPI0012E81BF6|nr:VacJ family lipoprotein [Sphingomonas profundi]
MSAIALLPAVALALAAPGAATDGAPGAGAAAPDPAASTPAAERASAVDAAEAVSPPQAPPEAPGRAARTPGDPLEGFNRFMFRVFRGLDKAVIRPLAMGYKTVVPKVLRSGLRHAFSNLGEPVVFLNDMLQLRPGRALRTFGRFAINSTLGVGGLIDVATPEKLPHRPNGFGDTLGFYGVKPGPYLFIPLLGPSTLRDLAGGTGDGLVLPTAVGSPFTRTDYRVGRAIVTGLDQRAESDTELTTLFDTALDPYATLRSVYLQSRTAEIAALKAPGRNLPGEAAAPDDPLADPLTDPLTDPAAEAAPPAAPAADPMADPLADPAPPVADSPAATGSDAPAAAPGLTRN